MGFFTKEEVPPAPDMSGVVSAGKEVTSMASDMAKETYDWATKAVADNKADMTKFVDQLSGDSDVARGMINDFQNIANQQLGLAQGAGEIKDAAMTQATKQGAVQDTQLGIQQKQLSEQDAQLKFQDELKQIQQDFRGDQQAIQQKADQLLQQYSKTYPGMMDRFAADAEAYASPERIAQARAGAQTLVGDQFQAARDAAVRQLEGFGVKPSDTRFAALDLGTRIKEAATKAAASQAAAQAAEDKGFALRQAAIQQGQQLPGQSTAMTGQANAAGNLVNAAGQTAVAQGNAAANYGQLANAAGANAIGAGNAATSALNAATGATNTGIAANTGATQATTGALAANTGAGALTGAAGELANKGLTTEIAAQQAAYPYVGAATGGVNAQTSAVGQDYKNKMDNFKAESTNTSGLGQLIGTVAGPLLKAGLTGGASLPFDAAGAAFGGSASSPLPGLTADDYGEGATLKDSYGLSFAEGGAIPMSVSPSSGQTTDDVKAMLNAGEFIVPKDVTSWYGEKFFQNLIQKAQNEKGKAQAKPAIGPAPPGPPTIASGPSAMQGAI